MSTIYNKIFLEGTINLVTGLHIGSGQMSFETDATVMKDSKGNPFIPGSSLKGVLRTIAERMHQVVLRDSDWNVPVCFLAEDDCNTNPNLQEEIKKYTNNNMEEDINELIEKSICPVCQLFGSTFRASKIVIHDSYFVEKTDPAHTTVRHSVAIDRDTGTAKEGAKYDFEVVDANQTFTFKIEGENLNPTDEKLLMIALSEMTSGHVNLGGKISRGLGVVKLENLEIHKYNLDEPEDKKLYLSSIINNGAHKEKARVEDWNETILNTI